MLERDSMLTLSTVSERTSTGMSRVMTPATVLASTGVDVGVRQCTELHGGVTSQRVS